MKHTIRFKYTMILTGVVAAVILASWIAVNLCLEPYYLQRKKNTLIQAYNELETRMENDGTVTADTKMYLRRVKENYNIEIFLWDSAQKVIYSSGSGEALQSGNTLFDYIFGTNQSVERLEATSKYQINKVYDGNLQAYYMEMFSSYLGGSFSLMRVPLQSIQETVRLVN